MSKAKRDIVIVGIGETKHARGQGRTQLDLCLDATLAACADAGIDPKSINGIVSEAYSTPHLSSSLHANLNLSEHTFLGHYGEYGAGMAYAPMLARMAVETGQADTFLCTWGVTTKPGLSPAGGVHASEPLKASLELPAGFFPQPVYMAAMANRYFAEYGVAKEKLASVAMSSRKWASLNPNAVIRKPLTREEYDASPVVADPFHVSDCCLLNDGACAFIMTTAERARDLRSRPIKVLAVSHAVDAPPFEEYLGARADKMSLPSRYSGPRAMKIAGISPDDVDTLHLYDCFSIIPVLQLEDMGFCERGEGLDVFASGKTLPGGELPVNTDGGHMGCSYIPGITHVVEAVKQLRGECNAERQVADAEISLVGAWGAREHTTLILGRE